MRPARALPYRLTADATVDIAAQTVSITFENDGCELSRLRRVGPCDDRVRWSADGCGPRELPGPALVGLDDCSQHRKIAAVRGAFGQVIPAVPLAAPTRKGVAAS